MPSSVFLDIISSQSLLSARDLKGCLQNVAAMVLKARLAKDLRIRVTRIRDGFQRIGDHRLDIHIGRVESSPISLTKAFSPLAT